MVCGRPIGQAIGIAGWNVEGIKDAQTVLWVRDCGMYLRALPIQSLNGSDHGRCHRDGLLGFSAVK